MGLVDFRFGAGAEDRVLLRERGVGSAGRGFAGVIRRQGEDHAWERENANTHSAGAPAKPLPCAATLRGRSGLRRTERGLNGA